MRTAFLRLLFLAVGTAATVIGCGSPGSVRTSLPPITGAAPAGAAADQEAALEHAVLRAHRKVTDTTGYTVIADGWYQPSPAPGKPGYYLIDGEVVKGPPDDSPAAGAAPVPQDVTQGAPAPAPTRNCTTFNGSIPPPCTSTGPFRRVYSGPGYSYALAQLTLPAQITTMPTAPSGPGPNPTPLHGDTGYIYFEGWVTSNPNGGNSEFGFQYSAKNNYYSAYYKTYSPTAQLYWQHFHWVPSTPVTFAIGGYTIAGQNYLHVALLGTTKEACTTTPFTTPTNPNLCLAHAHSLDTGWSQSGCCILARMTTIGQVLPNKFYDGVAFGPVTWSNAELAQTVPTPAPGSTDLPFNSNEPPWSGGGAQNWPPELNKVVVAGVTGTGETDTINLTKLPVLTLSLTPSTCQTVQDTGGTLNYTVTTTGATQGLSLQHGWLLFNIDPREIQETLSVPGGTYQDPYDSYELVGKGSAAAVTIKGPGTLYNPSNWGTGFITDLWYRDATGTLTNNWDGGFINAKADIYYGTRPRCPAS